MRKLYPLSPFAAFFTAAFYAMTLADSLLPATSLAWQPLNEPGVGGRIDSIAVSPHSTNHVLAGGDILGAYLSTNNGDSWSATSGWLNYEISDFTWHPENSDIVWAGSLSGPHLSTDGGRTWDVKRSGMPAVDDGQYTAPVEKVLFDPDSSRMLAFGGDHRQLKYERDILNYGTVWVTYDEGENWSRLSEIVKGANIMAASYAGGSSHEIYTAVWNRGAFYSSDDGATWTQRSGGLPTDGNGNIPISDLAVHPADSNTLWATVKGFGVYKSANAGQSWQLLNQGIPSGGSEFWSVEVSPDGQTLYAGNKNFSDRPGVYKSKDGGSSWQHQFHNKNQIQGSQKPYPGGIVPWWIEVSPKTNQTVAQTVFVGTDNAIYRSDDGGVNWAILGAQKTAQGWRGSGFSGLVARNVEWNPYDQNHVVLQGMDGAKAIQSWDGGNNWRVNNSGLPSYQGGHDVAFAPGSVFSVFGQRDKGAQSSSLIGRSQDAGRSWTLLPPPVNAAEATQIHVDPNNSNRLWVVIDQQLWYSNNANQSATPAWTQLNVGFGSNAVGEIEAIPGSEDMFYIATGNGVYRTNNGIDFNPIGGPTGAVDAELAISAANPNVLYTAQTNANQNGIWRYSTLENSWSPLWTNPPVTSKVGDIAVHPTNPNVLALITHDQPFHDKTWATGVWLSQDAGTTWRQENQGLPMLRGEAIAFHPNGQSLAVGLGGAGFYTTNLDGT